MSPRGSLALLLCSSLLVLGCATTRDSLHPSAAGPEEEQVRQAEVPEEPQTPPTPVETGLEIKTSPEGAGVFLDNQYRGRTPLLLQDLDAGRYLLRLEKEGYYPHTVWLDYGGGRLVYSTRLNQITGFLQVDARPPGARITAGDYTLTSGVVQELPVGLYTLRVRLFGFEEHAELVAVSEKALTRLGVDLPGAAFRIEDLQPGRGAFNPRNPGLLGRTRVRFRVSTFGTGRAVILDGSGTEVWSTELPRFTTWEQSFAWNGRSASGDLLPEGEYTVRVEASAESPPSAEPVTAEGSVRIDGSLVLSYRSLWTGASGLLFAPTPETLPRRAVQLSTLLQAHAEPSGAEAAYRVPWDLGLRLGLGARNDWELDLHGGLILGYGDSVPFFVSAAVKKSLLAPGASGWLSLAALAKLGYQSVLTDPFASFTGLTVGLPAAAVFGRFSLVLCPELTFSLWEPSLTRTEWPEPSFEAWAYLKGGLVVDLNPWTLGLSAALRTLPFGSGFGLGLPVQSALELHWMIPGTQLFLTAAARAEAHAGGDWYFSGGAGLGLLN